MSCSSFIEHVGETGFGETAMASNSVGAPVAAGATSERGFDQVLYQFASASAASGFASDIRSIASRCGTFTATNNGETGKLAMKATSGPSVGGHPSVDLQESGTIGGSSVALDILFTASGVDVFGVAAVGAGTTPPTTPARDTLTYGLMKRQAAAAVLG
jgi:hypothetical protein